ncbi:MAG: tRNA (adenosine(37)-N6)-threonylcarbamoyltransferase complex dimerization subunit type 1 TsaB [Candidatus Latescibacteria bacterium]|nr:tRNA (adenosine(37)-N6)-threonylcarbamoyltransferase complex dimerization subunit type 1 TsaB [Candidatus Latescibacterota bacterium]
MRSILGIDTAGPIGSVALAEDGAAAAWEILPPGGHSGALAEAVGRLVRGRGADLSNLTGIAVSSGPGSFTGLRIGLAWAKGFCFVRGIPIVLISSHEALAHRHRAAGTRVGTLLPGGRGEVQWAVWEGGSRASLVHGPDRVPEEGLGGALRAAAPPIGAVLVAGIDLAPEIRGALKAQGYTILGDSEPGPGASVADRSSSHPPTAASVAELGDREILEGRAADPIAAAPAYGRAPNARRPAR